MTIQHPELTNHALQTGQPVDALATRSVFWQNIVREILTTLSASMLDQPELFDGRMAVITHTGQRIPIAAVYPLFSCAITRTAWEREASAAVESTVFQIKSPQGEIFTLPVSEIRMVHSLSADLIEKLQKASHERNEDDGSDEPFGLAAFRSMTPVDIELDSESPNSPPPPVEQPKKP